MFVWVEGLFDLCCDLAVGSDYFLQRLIIASRPFPHLIQQLDTHATSPLEVKGYLKINSLLLSVRGLV